MAHGVTLQLSGKDSFFCFGEGGVSFCGGGEFVMAEGGYQGTGKMDGIKVDHVKDTKSKKKIFLKKFKKN